MNASPTQRQTQILLLLGSLATSPTALAKYPCGDPHTTCTNCPPCPTSSANNAACSANNCGNSAAEGTTQESLSTSGVQSDSGPTLDFTATYNSNNADGTRAQI